MPLGNQKASSKNLTQDPRDALGPLVDPLKPQRAQAVLKNKDGHKY